MLKDLISVSIFVSEHLRLSANNDVGCVWFSFPWIISPIALMIAQRLASDGCREQYLSLSISLSLCSGAWHYGGGLSGGGTPFVVRKSMSQSLASVNVCVCVFVCENEDKMAPAGGQSRLEPAGRGQRYYHWLCALWWHDEPLSIVIGLFVCRWVMACPASGPERQGEPLRAGLILWSWWVQQEDISPVAPSSMPAP